MFVNDELEKNEPSDYLNQEESVQLLNKIGRKWFKLDESEKNTIEERFKSMKKSVKKTIKNFVKVLFKFFSRLLEIIIIIV